MASHEGREALARIIYEADDGPKHGCDSSAFEDVYQRPWLARADAILASDWLKAHDAEVAAGARMAERVRMKAWLDNHAEELVREAADRIARANEATR